MKADRTIYLRPGQTIDVRFITDPEDELSHAAWKDQSRPTKLLMRVWPERVSPADHAVRLDNSPEAWR